MSFKGIPQLSIIMISIIGELFLDKVIPIIKDPLYRYSTQEKRLPNQLRTLHVVCREKFAKYLRKICEKFAKYSRKICEKFTKNLRKIRKKIAKNQNLRKFREKIMKNQRILIFRNFFANFSQIFCKLFAYFSRIFGKFFANILRIFREFFTIDHVKSLLAYGIIMIY